MANTIDILSDVKLILGYSTNKLDTILTNYIEAGKLDLIEQGIKPELVVESNALVYSALISFVLSMVDTYEYRELSANAYALQKDQLRHYKDFQD